MYPSYLPLPATSKAEKDKISLQRNLAKIKKLDHPLLIGFTVLLLLMGLVVLSLGATAHIKLEEKEDAGLMDDMVTDLRTVTVLLTILGTMQTAQSIFALVSLIINKFSFLLVYIIGGVLAMISNVVTAGYAFYCREQTHDYVQEHPSCTICDVSHDVVFKYALPAMAIALATAVFHAVTFVTIYRVIKYAYRKEEMKTVEKRIWLARQRKYIRPQGHQWNDGGHVTPPTMPSFCPPPFQYPPATYPPATYPPATYPPPLTYLDSYSQVPSTGYHNPYNYGSAAVPSYGGWPYSDVHRGLSFPGYALEGVNNSMLPDGTAIQDNLYQPTAKPKSETYSWRSHRAPLLPARETGEMDGRCLYMRNGDAEDWTPY